MPLKTREGWNSEQVRNKALFSILDDLSRRQQEVYSIIEKFQPISNESIAKHLNLYPHQVTPRVLELREMGIVEWAGEGKTLDNRPFSFWKISHDGKQLNLF
jgi:predicted ArsR family transcriptional regulator